MPRPRQIPVLALLAVLVGLPSTAPTTYAQATADDLAVPAPAAVALDPATTTLLAVDFLQSTCAPNPVCVGTLPAVANALSSARAAGAHVVYSVHPDPDNVILDDVAPMPDEPIFVAVPGDKFFNSELGDILQQNGTTTLVLTGISSNSGVMYTAAAAIQRGYTVVIAEDGISAGTELATSVALWQVIHAPSANVQNVPLQARSATLSRTDLITYR